MDVTASSPTCLRRTGRTWTSWSADRSDALQVCVMWRWSVLLSRTVETESPAGDTQSALIRIWGWWGRWWLLTDESFCSPSRRDLSLPQTSPDPEWPAGTLLSVYRTAESDSYLHRHIHSFFMMSDHIMGTPFSEKVWFKALEQNLENRTCTRLWIH